MKMRSMIILEKEPAEDKGLGVYINEYSTSGVRVTMDLYKMVKKMKLIRTGHKSNLKYP